MAEEVEMEVEAVQAVYGPDCTVLCDFPPRLRISLRPRTADDLCVQFVEAKVIITASVKYPDEAPMLDLTDAKGLGDSRHAKMLEVLHAQAKEMAGEPMLVAICEAATDLLTEMNVPDGDCCFCMNPFVMEDGAQPFLKLMSCFHCFHSDCFGKWWKWVQQQHRESSLSGVSASRLDDGDGDEDERSEMRSIVEVEDVPVNCPVCRMVVSAEDVTRVREYLTAEHNIDNVQSEDDAKVPASVLTTQEVERRNRFTAEFEAQQARGAITEPKKLEVILPGMVVPPRTPPVVEQPSALGTPESAAPEDDQASPTSIVDSPVPSSSLAFETSRAGSRHIGHGSKGHSHHDDGQGSRGVSGGRRGGTSRGSHVSTRSSHGKSKVRKDHGHGPNDSPRQHTHSSRHQPLGSRKGGNAHKTPEWEA